VVNYEAIINLLTERSKEIYDWAGHRVREMITMKYPPDTRILDVGAGQGKYRVLLSEYEYVYAVEVFEPYVEDNRLRDLYFNVFVEDIRDFVDNHGPSFICDLVVVMGDVLEHLTRDDAREVLAKLRQHNAEEIIVVVPYEYPQGEEDGNVHQEHLQDDLTVELMAREYPELTLVDVEVRDDRPFKGIYQWRR
jgi:hypothetical protein